MLLMSSSIVSPRFPLMLATWSFGQPAIAAAWPALIAGGSSIDAIEAACRCAEDDLENPTVGRGSYPDRDGNITLDAAVMLSPAKSGAVCGTRSTINPITAARRVMQNTTHKMLAGAGADLFVTEQGLGIGELNTEFSRRKWEEWKQSGGPAGPILNIEEKHHDTIGVLAIDAAGVIAAGCSTSGLAWKLPGRVGDSPIIGHGLYAKPGMGACVCTGLGEMVSGVCGAFLAVETLRRGGSPLDAVSEVLNRVSYSYELTEQSQVGLIVLHADGGFSTGSLRPGYQTAVRDQQREELLAPQLVLLSS